MGSLNKVTLLLGDCRLKMAELPDNSVDSIVTDPPYGLAFMGKKWDYEVPSVEIWKEALRVLKPGGHLLSFGGTRTYHRMVVNIEDAGFEIRDCIQWLYGSGFPKSQNVGKQIIKQNSPDGTQDAIEAHFFAELYSGWGTALKPAHEPICVARKPLEKGLTVAENVLKYGTGAINIDGSRIEAADQAVLDAAVKRMTGNAVTKANSKNFLEGQAEIKPNSAQGRWPANIILDEDAAKALDEQTEGQLHSAGRARQKVVTSEYSPSSYHAPKARQMNIFDDGNNVGASRFFYVAKASKSERGTGNVHPTVKPIKLMQYLINLVTPPNGTVLDPFMGSGTTGVAAVNLSRPFIGCEMSEEYLTIATNRIRYAAIMAKREE